MLLEEKVAWGKSGELCVCARTHRHRHTHRDTQRHADTLPGAAALCSPVQAPAISSLKECRKEQRGPGPVEESGLDPRILPCFGGAGEAVTGCTCPWTGASNDTLSRRADRTKRMWQLPVHPNAGISAVKGHPLLSLPPTLPSRVCSGAGSGSSERQLGRAAKRGERELSLSHSVDQGRVGIR